MPHFSQTIYAHLSTTRAAVAFVDRHIVAFNVSVLALIVTFLALYIGQVNLAIAKGYAQRDLETKSRMLSEENRRLELAVSRIQTLDHVERSVKILGLVPAERPTFLVSSAPSVAFAR